MLTMPDLLGQEWEARDDTIKEQIGHEMLGFTVFEALTGGCFRFLTVWLSIFYKDMNI